MFSPNMYIKENEFVEQVLTRAKKECKVLKHDKMHSSVGSSH